MAADVLLIVGGFLLGSNLDFSSNVLGASLVAVGLFLSLRVLWKFSSDLKNLKAQIDKDRNDLERTKRKVDRMRREAQETFVRLKQTEEKLFGFRGSTFSESTWTRPLEGSVGELKQKVSKLEEKVDKMHQEHERNRRVF